LWNFFSKLRTDIFCTIEISISTWNLDFSWQTYIKSIVSSKSMAKTIYWL
jgi:hypothetical protein